MATYHVCDRCGKKLILEGGKLYGELFAPRNFIGIFDAALFNAMLGYKSTHVDIELCENCAKELAEWLHIDDNSRGSV